MIDERTPAEFREVHLDVAHNVPLDQLDPNRIQAARNGPAEQLLDVICRSLSCGKQPCEKLVADGLVNVVNVAGGAVACEAAGSPVIRGKKTIALDYRLSSVPG